MSHDDSTQTDRLLHAFSEGDQSALSKLIQLHVPYLRTIIKLRMSDELRARLDVSDVVQETQLVVTRRISEFVAKRPATSRVWLRSRAIEQLTDEYRRHILAQKRTVRREHEFNDVSSLVIARALVADTPSKMLQRRELAEQIQDLVKSLEAIDREILMLRHGEGLTNAESAEALEILPATARRRYGRALRRLVERAAEAGLDAECFEARS